MNRSIIAFFLLSALFIAGATSLTACEIEVKVKEEQKSTYAKADILILEITVFLTHRDCPEGINATKYQGEGIELLGAKSWQQISPDKFTRLVKVQITGSNNGEAVLHARRSCDKEGGHGVFKVKVR